MEPILKIRNLSISFTQYEKGTKQRKVETIRNLSLEILPGQVAAVVGESGSGKSLLLTGYLESCPITVRWRERSFMTDERLIKNGRKSFGGEKSH